MAREPTGTETFSSNGSPSFAGRTQADLTVPRTVAIEALTALGPVVFDTCGAMVTVA